jgi:hypothetical protein
MDDLPSMDTQRIFFKTNLKPEPSLMYQLFAVRKVLTPQRRPELYRTEVTQQHRVD